uniref:Uncharacterized protein n=1 Tax=Triticum urartu TaxID=4572 RepID=A0A8R7UGG7_TRIUA
MPCLAHDRHPSPRPPAANHCKSLSCLIRETYAHCHVPCIGIAGAGWSSGDDSDDDDDDMLDTKQVAAEHATVMFLIDLLGEVMSNSRVICLALMVQVILNEIRNRQLRKESRCSVDSAALSGAFIWFFTPLDPRSVLEKVSSPEKHVVAGEEKGEAEAGSDAGDVESEAFFSVKSFFTRSTSRAATVASLTDMDPPATWDGFRDCEGWPFGLCRRPAVPPLPSTPADSWKWRKQSSGRSLAASPRPSHGDKITAS